MASKIERFICVPNNVLLFYGGFCGFFLSVCVCLFSFLCFVFVFWFFFFWLLLLLLLFDLFVLLFGFVS